jgi:hypothetical protein
VEVAEEGTGEGSVGDIELQRGFSVGRIDVKDLRDERTETEWKLSSSP